MKKQLSGVSLLWSVLLFAGCGGEGGTTIVVQEPSSSSSSGGGASSSSSSSGGGFFGSFVDSTVPAELQPLLDQYGALTSLDAVDGMPFRLTSAQFESLVKNGLRREAAIAYPTQVSHSSSSSSGSLDPNFSTVPIPQAFVVASDPVKIGLRNTLEVFDGQYWFVSSVSNLGTELNLDIVELNGESANIQPLIDFKLVGNNPFRFEGVRSLNIVQDETGQTDKLILVAQSSPVDGESVNYFDRPIEIYFVGVDNLQSPQNSNKLTVRGQVLASHQAGDMLYLFNQRRPLLDGLITSGDSLAEAVQANETLIEETAVNGFFSERTDNTECFAPAYAENSSVDSFIDVVAIDLNTESIAFSDCLVAAMQGLYFEGDHFYTWASRSTAPLDKTVLYKFALQPSAITPVSWGSVDSRIVEKNYMPQKKIHVENGKVRLITTNSNRENVFYVLGENNNPDRLDVLGQLPSSENSAPLASGKSIFGATFIGDKSYIATINGNDFGLSSANPAGPTYVVSTEYPSNPVVEMQLQLTDYASFIKPLSDNYLLTVSRAGLASYDAQVDLLDVSDPTAPQVVSSHSFAAPAGMSSSGGPLTNAPAVFDAQSVAIVQASADSYRIAVPFDFTARVDNVVSATTDMLFFEATGLDDVADLELLGQVRSHTYACGDSFSEGYGCIYSYLRGDRRNVALGDSLFYFYEGAENVGPTAISSFKWDNFSGIVKRTSLGDTP